MTDPALGRRLDHRSSGVFSHMNYPVILKQLLITNSSLQLQDFFLHIYIAPVGSEWQMKLAASRVFFGSALRPLACVLTVGSRKLCGLEHRKCIITQRMRFCNQFPKIFVGGKLLKQF